MSGSAKSSLDAKMSQLSLDGSVEVSALVERLHRAEAESIELKSKFQLLESRVAALEGGKAPAKSAAAAPALAKPAPAKPAKNDDDFDLFEEDAEEDTEEKKRITEERLKAYNAKKSNSKKLNISIKFFFNLFINYIYNMNRANLNCQKFSFIGC